MISLLAKLFIKNRGNPTDPQVRSAYGMLCGIAGIILNLFLFAMKLTSGLLSASVAIMADAFNNLSDAASSLITLIGFKLARQKPDADHPFGHGRFECITGLIVSFIILLMGFELAKTSFDKILHPSDVDITLVSLLILAASVLIKLYMFLYNRAIAKKISSETMMAAARDSISDSCATFVVLVSAIIQKTTGFHIDGWTGILVSGFILFVGCKSVRETVSPLLGQPPTSEFVAEIRRIVLSHSPVIGIHDLVVHDYGPGRVMISLHAEIDAKSDILAAHDLIDNIEHDLADALKCSAVIHMDPIITDDAQTNESRTLVEAVLTDIAPEVSMHDYRIVVGPTHTNLIFDIVIPFDAKRSDRAIRAAIAAEIHHRDPRYYAVIDIDHGKLDEIS
ncbi:MAG: cation transporter [Clostridia bacterium]|nr:cation transporter [Clostridia bacterium]